MRVLTIGPSGEEDNYAYIIYDTLTLEGAVVDPSQCGDAVVAAIEASGIKLVQVLTTHHHWDHAFGNKKLRATQIA